MPIHFRSLLTLKYKDLINEKFKFLVSFFNFEPGDVFIEVLPLNAFERYYELERGKKPDFFVVGSALNNGLIIILDKEDFEKKEHKPEEFERVILHELAHIFVRRILWPKQMYTWIEEGICEHLSFGDFPPRLKKIVSFEEIETPEGWRKHNAYQQAKEFFNYLSKNYGKEKIPELLIEIKKSSEKNAFKKVFGKELEIIEKDFLVYLQNKKIIL